MAVYFFSDLHLGSGDDSVQREKELCEELEQVSKDADAIVLLGDMFDFWFSYKHVVPRGGIRLLGKMAELSDRGIQLHYFLGNHDMWLFDYLTSEMKIAMHDEPCVLTFDKKKFLCGHGDGLGHLDKSYDILRRVFRNKVNQWAFALLPTKLTFGIACGWSRHSRRRHGIECCQYLGDEKEGIVLHCKEVLQHEKIDYCIFGHRHYPIQRTITAANGATSEYINTGDWLYHRSYARYVNGNIELIEKR